MSFMVLEELRLVEDTAINILLFGFKNCNKSFNVRCHRIIS